MFHISDETLKKGEIPPAQKYLPGYKFNMLNGEGLAVEVEVKRYLPASKEFIIDYPLGGISMQRRIPLSRLDELTDPRLNRYPIGTNVNIQRSDKTATTGKIAGYSQSENKYVVLLPNEKVKSNRIEMVSPEVLDALNFRGRVKELLQ
jgi:hypothetical protein